MPLSRPSPRPWRHAVPCALLALTFAFFAGCGRPPTFTDTKVTADSIDALGSFRTDLGKYFPSEDLASFDTALQELRLEALNQDISPASAREEYVRAIVHDQTVGFVRTRGWEARRTRLQAEIKYLSGLLEHDLARQQKSPTDSVASRISSAREVLARLERDLADTESRLAIWSPASP